MLLSADDAELFFRLYRSLMWFVNDRLRIVPDIGSPDEFSALPPKRRLEVRKVFLNEAHLIESFVNENPANLSEEETDIVFSWKHQVSGRFYAFRQLKKHMIFLPADGSLVAYGVVALTEPFESLIGPHLPVMAETVLMPFKDELSTTDYSVHITSRLVAASNGRSTTATVRRRSGWGSSRHCPLNRSRSRHRRERSRRNGRRTRRQVLAPEM